MTRRKLTAKRWLSLLLVLSMALSMVITTAGAAETQSGPALSGSGTELDPYLIEDAEDLQILQAYINGGGGSQVYHYYRQTADIDLSGIANWMPIGSEHREGSVLYVDYRFSGVYDGNGYEIRNMTIDTYAMRSTNTEGFGLFGHISNATIKDLTVSGTITHTKISGNSAAYGVGGIAGLTIGLYSDDPDELNAYSDCFISGCSSNVTINAQGLSVGGLVGGTQTNTHFTNCDFNGSITVSSLTSTFGYSDYGVGGILGSSGGYDTFSGCVNNGNITATGNNSEINLGGIVGWLSNGASTTIDSCYNTGVLTADHTSSATGVGGIVGKRTNGYGGTESSAVSVTNCYNMGTLTAQDEGGSTGGIIGRCVTADVYGDPIWAEGTLKNIFVEEGTASYIIRAVTDDLAGTVTEGSGAATNAGTFTSGTALLSQLAGDYTIAAGVNDGYPIFPWQDPNHVYNVSFRFLDAATGVDLGIARVDLNYENGLKSGKYPYTVTKSGYTPVSGTLSVVRSDKTEPVLLAFNGYTYTLEVTPADASVKLCYEDGTAVAPGEKRLSGGAASYTFALNSYIYGDYTYTVSCFGYEKQSDTIEVYEDDSASVDLVPSEKYAVTFAATDGTAPVAIREVTVTSDEYGVTAPAESDGTYNLPAGSYAALVKATGYANKTVQFTVSGAMTVDVELSDGAWDGVTTDTGWYSAERNSYYIYNANELAGFAQLVNEGNSFVGKTVCLGADIDLNSNAWTPIGEGGTAYAFKGVFDGQGHSISGLKINNFSIDTDLATEELVAHGKNNQGLFGYLNGAVIQNVSVTSASGKEIFEDDVTSNTSQSIMGIIAAQAVSSTFTRITTDGELYSEGMTIGGIVGQAAGCTFTSCINNAAITGAYSVGGLVGQTATSGSGSTFTACANTGSIFSYYYRYVASKTAHGTGGILGYAAVNGVVIDRCVNSGTILGNSHLGGILGTTDAKTATITNCYNAGTVAISNAEVITADATYDEGTGDVLTPVQYGVQDGLYAVGILGYSGGASTVKNSYNRGILTDYSGAENIIAPIVGLALEGMTLENNYYLAETAGTDGAFAAADDYNALIASLGDAYCADTKPSINEGFPILKWQDTGSSYTVSFAVTYDTEANKGGNSAAITVDGAAINGTSVSLTAGDHTYTVAQKGYETVSDAVSVIGADVNIPVTLKAQRYTYTFTTNGSVVLKQEGTVIEPTSAANGVYVYELYNGTYEYTVSRTNYTAQSGNITVSYAGGNRDLTLTAAQTYAVSFDVTADGSSFADWTVTITGAEGVNIGSYQAGDSIQLMDGTYAYTLTAAGYEDATGSFSVSGGAVTVPATMERIVAAPWDGTSDTSWYDADASEYHIYTAEQLAGLAALVNSGTGFSDKTLYLENNLDLGENAWLGIGNYYSSTERSFQGTFDGQSHTIRMQGGFTTADQANYGLFGLTNGAVIKNLVLAGQVDFSGAYAAWTTVRIGGLIGWAKNTTVENVSNRRAVQAEIQNSGSTFAYAGGLIGVAESTMLTACNNIGPINVTVSGGASWAYVGGLIGSVSGTSSLESCYNTGIVNASAVSVSTAGGLAAKISGTYSLNNNYATGRVTAETAGALIAGLSSTDYTNNYYLDSLTSEVGTAKSDSALRSEEFAASLGGRFQYVTGAYPLNDWEGTVSRVSIETMPDKTVYNDLEAFDSTGMTLTVIYDNGETGVVSSGWTVLNGDRLAAGQTSVTVEYMGKRATISITVNQIEHEIGSSDLNLALAAPGAELVLSDAQSAKYGANVAWYCGGVPASTFEANKYYYAVVTLTAVNDETVWYHFAQDAAPTVTGAYELLNMEILDEGRTMIFLVTFSVSDELTDEASHLYYEGIDVSRSACLDSSVAITVDGVTEDTTIRALEQLALEGSGVEKTYGTVTVTGLPLYALLNRDGALDFAADESTVTIGSRTLTFGDLRTNAGLDYLMAYGVNGAPLDGMAVYKNGTAVVENVTSINAVITPTEIYEVTFMLDQTVPAETTLTITDANGNTVYSGGLGTVELRTGTYTYTAVTPGYATRTGTVSAAGTVTLSMLPVWNGTYVQPQVDSDGTFLIGTAEELAWFNYQATSVSMDRASEMAAANVRLTADICMTGYNWVPIGPLESVKTLYPSTGKVHSGGPYTGTFDGGGHTIYGLTIDRENEYSIASNTRLESIGLFGYTKNATIRNLGVEGSISILDRAAVAYDWLNVGGIAGFANATTISGCYVNLDIEATVDLARFSACNTYVGGIAGAITRGTTIENCYSLGSIYGECTTSIDIGGIAGADRVSSNTSGNKITKCYSAMSLSANPDITGMASETSYVGGIVGEVSLLSENDIPEISYCFALNDVLDGNHGAQLYAGRLLGNGDKFNLSGIYNFALDTMEIRNAAIGVYDVDDSGYRSSWGRDITKARAYTEEAFTNVLWNYEYDEEADDYYETIVWSFESADTYPVFVWQYASTEQSTVVLGDVNGDGKINAIDAMLTLRYAAALIELDETQKLAADVNGDGFITAADASLILRYSIGLITDFGAN